MEKLVKWFGYKLHLIIDAETELPIDYLVTRASSSDITTAHKMIDQLKTAHPEKLVKAQAAMLDKGYDDEK
ncbi:transposase [Sporolactobacillus inulinus]|uniref:transposase n=1 Tax=Sporolactobacillus inulinus TaxID=2078 RepID=UPI000255BDE2|nr:transposase [Sporolactobacillus inulinus]GEB76408.1 hypothetical protein SIN01_07530 [Sporolactobacillus inulinus]